MPRSHQMQNSSLKWSWWILNEEFPVLLGIHSARASCWRCCNPGSGYSGAFVEMSAECCPCPAAVVTAPPLKQSLYLPVPPFFVSVLPLLLCRALQSPQSTRAHAQPGLLPPLEPNPTAFPLHSPMAPHSARAPSPSGAQSHSIPTPQSHGPTLSQGSFSPVEPSPTALLFHNPTAFPPHSPTALSFHSPMAPHPARASSLLWSPIPQHSHSIYLTAALLAEIRVFHRCS